jgi:hypothetical protein
MTTPAGQHVVGTAFRAERGRVAATGQARNARRSQAVDESSSGCSYRRQTSQA